jgi:hypothetical protein
LPQGSEGGGSGDAEASLDKAGVEHWLLECQVGERIRRAAGSGSDDRAALLAQVGERLTRK